MPREEIDVELLPLLRQRQKEVRVSNLRAQASLASTYSSLVDAPFKVALLTGDIHIFPATRRSGSNRGSTERRSGERGQRQGSHEEGDHRWRKWFDTKRREGRKEGDARPPTRFTCSDPCILSEQARGRSKLEGQKKGNALPLTQAPVDGEKDAFH